MQDSLDIIINLRDNKPFDGGLLFNRAAIISSKKSSEWISCQSIQKNLLQAYKLSGIETNFLLFSGAPGEAREVTAITENIIHLNPQVVIFVDHKPHPHALIKSLAQIYKNKKRKPELHFHVYGDFPLYIKEWKGAEKYLKTFQVRWICASEAQRTLLLSLLRKPTDCVHIPFPISTQVFRPTNTSELVSLRRRLGIPNKSKVLLYTGRLSRQKQILSLIKCFDEASVHLIKSKKAAPYLLLAGTFDDLGRPYLDEHDNLNQYFSEYALLKNSLSPEVSKRILYLGNLKEGPLCDLYNLADAYISLSLHNDEDFGMSPAEALCSGAPAILTSWGGFNSFSENFTSVTAISTDLDSRGPSFNKKAVVNSILTLCLEGSRSFSQRQKLAKEAHHFMSIKAVADKLKDLRNTPASSFLGFNTFMKSLPSHLHKPGPLFYENSKLFNDEYLRLYNSYVLAK